ncbi:MAG TPA: acyltransferase [candidate division Zixibacteria bacterium]|nr:acyltransferase [candidate division Zixibacteria bacterium]
MRRIVKYTILSITYLLVIPAGWSAKLLYVLFKSQMLFHFFAESFSMIPGYPGQAVRVCFYYQTLEQAHLDMVVAFFARFTKMQTRVGHNVTIAGHATVGCADIGDRAVIGNNVNVLSGRHQHNFSDPDTNVMDGSSSFYRVSIGADSFIGDKSVVMADIGEKTIIGAGSIVVKPIPDLCVAVGNPAQVIKHRTVTSEVTSTTI